MNIYKDYSGSVPGMIQIASSAHWASDTHDITSGLWPRISGGLSWSSSRLLMAYGVKFLFQVLYAH
jgi:hypothetical protein